MLLSYQELKGKKTATEQERSDSWQSQPIQGLGTHLTQGLSKTQAQGSCQHIPTSDFTQ